MEKLKENEAVSELKHEIAKLNHTVRIQNMKEANLKVSSAL